MQLTNLSTKSVSQILELERSKKKFTLTNIKKFLKHLGSPQLSLNVIHVAGTNGKGSVASMLSSVLSQDAKVGLFTSPHLIKVNERIQINNRPISDKDLDQLTKHIQSLQKKYKIQLTFFETITVIAFLYFKKHNVDYTILEVGMGGRLDATNTIESPLLSIITNVGLDHQEILGNTIEKIAKEKAGIIRSAPVITNAQGTALETIKKICKKQNTQLILGKKTKFRSNLIGEFQKENTSTAVTALKHLKIPKKQIKSGLKKVRWPGRFEKKKNIILDAAHNEQGFISLTNSIKKIKHKRLILVLGLMHDKDTKSIAKTLSALDPITILTKADVKRSADPKQLAKHFNNPIIIEDAKQAILKARSIAKKKDLILITGSIYLLGEIYSFLNHQTPR